MTVLTIDKAAALAERLAVPLDGICLVCLSFVSSAIAQNEEAAVRLWVRRMTPDLWNDGLDDIAKRHVAAIAASDADAAVGLVDLERDGPRSALARMIVLDLGRRLLRGEEETASAHGAEEDTRDGKLVERISAVQEAVGTLSRELKNLDHDAREAEAYGHAGLYREVHGLLEAAFSHLDEAWDVMKNGDPENYA